MFTRKYFLAVYIMLLCCSVGNTMQAHTTADYADIFAHFDHAFIEGATTTNDWDYPVYSDEEYRSRINSISSAVPLTYNSTVRNYIHVYTLQKRDLSERVLGKIDEYFPLFKPIMDKYNVPDAIKYLAVTESALNTHAVSRAGATGLWQIMSGTAKDLGLTVNSQVDERRDPLKATEAAMKFLSRLYRKYGSWTLAIAAYNCGPGNVNKAIRRSGGKRNFWSIKRYLPRETRGYVPSFIACVYWINFHSHHHLNMVMPLYPGAFASGQTVLMQGSFNVPEVAYQLGIDPLRLEYMNPAIRRKDVMQTYRPFPFRVPSAYVDAFRQSRFAAYVVNWSPFGNAIGGGNYANIPQPLGVSTDVQVMYNYTVKKEDNLTYICDWYNCTTSDLKRWNNLGDNPTLTEGQNLKVFVPRSQMSKYERINTMTFAEKQIARSSAGSRRTVHLSSSANNYPTHAKVNNGSPQSTMLVNGTTQRRTSTPGTIYHYPSGNTGVNTGTISSSSATSTTSTSNYQPDEYEFIRYKVRKGDNLTLISGWYNCTNSQLREWNKLRSSTLSVGQELRVRVKRGDIQKYSHINNLSSSQKKAKYGGGSATQTKIHKVRRGDTLSGIASKYRCRISDIKRWNGLRGSTIKVGQSLKIKK